MQRADDLLGVIFKQGKDINADDLSLIRDLVDEVDEIERQISHIPGSKHSMRGSEVVPVEDPNA